MLTNPVRQRADGWSVDAWCAPDVPTERKMLH